MPYEDVKAQCHFCGATVEGNQRFMLRGRTLPRKKGPAPKWLKEKPEHQWAWNGLSNIIGGKEVEFIFYLCPNHTDDEHYSKAFKWAQEQIDGQKALEELVV